MEKKYLIYFCKGIESVFDSQVLELIKSISERRVFRSVYLFLGIRDNNEMQELQKRKIPEGIKVITYKTYPNYVIFNYLTKRQLEKTIRDNREVFTDPVIHIREELMAWHVSEVLKKKYCSKILPDIRGATIEEILENDRLSIIKRIFKLWNYRRALKYLDNFRKISAVSESLKKYLAENFKINEKKISVTPDLAGKHFRYDKSQRSSIRKELNLNDEETLIIVSNGSTSQWQNWQDSGILQMIAGKNIKILNLSRYSVVHKNIINKFVKYEAVPLYLQAADLAIIWSNRRTVTMVRSPVKFSEYICCGLPIIANDSVDMITDYIKKTSYGILLKNIDQIDDSIISRLKNIDRTKIANYGQKWVGYENITDSYLQIYNSLC
ncbi:MAG: glycosyltransferase [Bacillota bacterium]